ncbi:hypothetical protein BUALT_Bualt11G0065900 [Buddleja alternifolia]|uniref:Uncharacterized protein n=1 Tax=Buddleja alternifolia TaxID=168488 RepID=A0AAV6WT17_9LAMI|nr:hypothetical protein BUALT_Bualt11G0065900 [Buddleja alternifolia]
MITSGVASQTAINSAIWFRGHRQTLPSGFTFRLPSASRKFFPLTASIDGKEKDPLYSYRALESNIPDRPLVHPVTTKIESTSEADLETILLKNIKSLDLDKSTVEDLTISNEKAPSRARTSRKETHTRSISSNAALSDQLPVIRYPLTTESALKAILESNTLVFVVDKRADKNIIKDTFKRMFKITAKKVNTLMTPDGTKKAYIMLPPSCKALDVAKNIKIL